MNFTDPLQEAVLIKRYKRFLADVRTVAGDTLTIHCPNTGSMKNCQQPGSRVWYSLSSNPARKYPGTWHFVEVNGSDLVGINTSLANGLVVEWVAGDGVSELADYDVIHREVPYGLGSRSRIDLLLESSTGSAPTCYVEVKNVSLGEAGGIGLFPDAVTERGQKHLRELQQVVADGHRAVLFFCVQHTGIKEVRPADEIDPAYGRLLREAAAAGVELMAVGASIDVEAGSVDLDRPLPVMLSGNPRGRLK